MSDEVKKPKQKYDNVACPQNLGMAALLDECEALTPPDRHGRRVPRYVILFQAITAHLAKLRKEHGDELQG